MSTIRDQVIDIAARAVHRTRFDHVPPGHYMLERAPVSRENRDAVCIWIGEMQAYNGGITIEEIVRLAEEAGPRRCTKCLHPAHGGEYCYVPSTNVLYPHCGCDSYTHEAEPIDLPAFIRALVGEGIELWRRDNVHCDGCAVGCPDSPGCRSSRCACHQTKVPSWFDDHSRFTVPRCAWCACSEPHDRQPREWESAEYCRNGFHDCHDYEPSWLIVPPLTLPHATEVEG